jgi:putative endonuclease
MVRERCAGDHSDRDAEGMAAKDDLGRAGEERAAQHLTGSGYTVLDRNWRCAQGEIDIVAAVGDRLAMIEVKTRRTEAFGHPFEAVDRRKLRRLWQLAHAWVASHPDAARGRAVRLEAIGIIGEDPLVGSLEHLVDIA